MGILTFSSLSKAKNNLFNTPASEFTGMGLAIATGLFLSYMPVFSLIFAPILLIALYNVIREGIAEATSKQQPDQDTHHREMIFGIGLICSGLLAAIFPVIGVPLLCWGLYKTLPLNPKFNKNFEVTSQKQQLKVPPSSSRINQTHTPTNQSTEQFENITQPDANHSLQQQH